MLGLKPPPVRGHTSKGITMRQAALVVALLIVGVVWSQAGGQPPKPPRVWEYTAVSYLNFPSVKTAMWGGQDAEKYKFTADTKVPEALNRYGADGWELVSVTDTSTREPLTMTFYFKREK